MLENLLSKVCAPPICVLFELWERDPFAGNPRDSSRSPEGEAKAGELEAGRRRGGVPPSASVGVVLLHLPSLWGCPVLLDCEDTLLALVLSAWELLLLPTLACLWVSQLPCLFLVFVTSPFFDGN